MKQKFSFDHVNLNNLNFKEICRFCLSNNGILLSLFGSKEDDALHELPKQMKSILSIEMEEDDGLPNLICHSCLCNLEKCLSFKYQCEQADTILRNYQDHHNSMEDEIIEFQKDVQLVSKEVQTPEEQELTMELKINSINPNEVKKNVGFTTEDNITIQDTVIDARENNNVESVNEGTPENNQEDFNNENTEGHEENNINLNPEIVINEKEIQTNHSATNDAFLKPETENTVEMEENLNDMDNHMFGSEPFSLDLCSVRLQSEGPDLEDTTLYPAAHYSDEEQWSDSFSDLSDEIDALEPVPRPVIVGSCNCTTCNKGFDNVTDLVRHQLIHKQEPPFPCDYCDSQFEEKTLLKAHWRTHAKNRPHMCLTCGEAYAERAQLIKHFAVHDLIKPYHCPGCGKAFAYRSDLRKHAVIHTGARPFKCPVCHKTFTRSTNLNKHARVHSNRRPYPCEHCDKMFSSRGDLVRHSVIHTGEKPYACLICSLAFNRKDKLSRHERVHMTDRPFVCSECPTSFHRKEELTKHIRFHHYKPDPEYYTLANCAVPPQ